VDDGPALALVLDRHRIRDVEITAVRVALRRPREMKVVGLAGEEDRVLTGVMVRLDHGLAKRAVVSGAAVRGVIAGLVRDVGLPRSEEHTSELQSRRDLVCRLLLEKKKKKKSKMMIKHLQQ